MPEPVASTPVLERGPRRAGRRPGQVWSARSARLAAATVATGAAALSFRATSQVAEASGAVGPGYGWIVPLVIEAGVLTAAALAWVRSGDGLRATTEICVMSGLLTLSIVINVAHAHHGTTLGRIIAAIPPLVLLAAVEGLLREQRRCARRDSHDTNRNDEIGDPESVSTAAAQANAPSELVVHESAMAPAASMTTDDHNVGIGPEPERECPLVQVDETSFRSIEISAAAKESARSPAVQRELVERIRLTIGRAKSSPAPS